MTDTIRPDFVEEEHLIYLDELRESGDVNMFLAGQYIEDEFEVEKQPARDILTYWIKTFSERYLEE